MSALRLPLVWLVILLECVLSQGADLKPRWGGDAVQPLAAITPCPAAPVSLAPPPVTVTEQYQPVSTCKAQTACIKRKCTTKYQYHTYDYVSTVIPCLDGASTTTVTETQQPVLISRSSEIIRNTRPITKIVHGNATATTAVIDATTIVKEWSAPFKDIGPLALPNYEGSGLCKSCKGPKGEIRQVLNVIECTSRHRRGTICRKNSETWLYNPAPTSTSALSAVCSLQTSVAAGTYTFAFPQRAPPATIRVPQRIVTYTVGEIRPSTVTTTITETVTTVPEREWTAWVTRSCARPTKFEFEVTVTTTIVYTVPPFVVPGPRPTSVPVPSGWQDWTVSPTVSATLTSSSVSASSSSATSSLTPSDSPIGYSTSTTSSTFLTSQSSSWTTPTTASTSSSSTSSNSGLGPIQGSTSTTESGTSTTTVATSATLSTSTSSSTIISSSTNNPSTSTSLTSASTTSTESTSSFLTGISSTSSTFTSAASMSTASTSTLSTSVTSTISSSSVPTTTTETTTGQTTAPISQSTSSPASSVTSASSASSATS
ncbi:hypothetical protein HRR90_001179, partial [Exophiala dermatitidis]